MRTVLAWLLLTCCVAVSAAEDPWRGQVVVVTGSSSGLGHVLAEQLAARGARLVLADIDLPASAALAKRIEGEGGAAVAVQVDLADAAQRGRVIDTAMARFGRIDVLVNNAGYNYATTLELLELDQAHHLFEVNYWAYVDLAQRVVPLMREQGGGVIVNVASILGHRAAPPSLGIYSASKHALVGFFQAAAAELAPHGIKVRIASPAGMRTNIARNAVGPLADASRGMADDWEDPAIAARDILEQAHGDAVVIYPGYIGAVVRGEG